MTDTLERREAMQDAIERCLADFDDNDRAEAGFNPLMEAHVADFRAALALTTSPREGIEPFGYWVEQRHADPVLLRKPAFIPEPSELRTVTPLYRRLP